MPTHYAINISIPAFIESLLIKLLDGPLMKTLLVLLSLVAAGAAQAFSTVTPLVTPQVITGYQTHTGCAPITANANDTVLGACYGSRSAACSGRGCQPTTYITTYIVDWDLSGNPTFVESCRMVRRHLPQPDAITYLNGHSATDCLTVVSNPLATVVEVPDGPYTWQVQVYYYVATSADGLYELVDNAIVSPVVQPVPQS
jgi:hypothetical protein